MNRREFFAAGLAAGSLGFGTGASLAQNGNNPLYEIMIFKMKNGDQGQRMDDWCQSVLLPLAAENGIGPIGIFKAAIADYTPHMMFLIEHPDLGSIRQRWAGVTGDARWRDGMRTLEKDDNPAYESYETRLLSATSFSPPLKIAPENQKPRLFEFRVYHAPTIRQLLALAQRFKGPEIKLFHKSGIHPILYAYTMYGPDMPNLTYMMPFDSLKAREEAWAKFRQDPEWKRVLADSKEKDGEIVAYLSRNIYNAADYSQIK